MERNMLSEKLCYFLWDLKNPPQNGLITTTENIVPVLQYTSFVLSMLTCVIGLVGNTIVIIVTGFMMKEKRSRIWFLNLAVADIVFLLFLPLSAISLLKGNWPFGSHLCKAYHFFSNVNMYASIFIIIALNIDRALAVAKPMWHLKLQSPRACYLTCAFIWAITVISSLPITFSSDEYTVGEEKQCLFGYIENNNGHNVSEEHNAQQVIKLVKEKFFRDDVRKKRNIEDNDNNGYSGLLTNTTEVLLETSYRDNIFNSNGTYLNGGTSTIITTEILKTLSFNIIETLAEDNLKLFPEFRDQCEANDCCANEEEITKWNQMLFTTESLVIPLIVIGFFIPLCIILFSNVIIAVTVVRSGRNSRARRSSRLSRILITVVLVYFLTWTPLVTGQIICLAAARKMNFLLLVKVNMILPLLASIAYSNSCLNPIIYVLLGRNVKTVLRASIKNVRRSFSRNSHKSVQQKIQTLNVDIQKY